MERKQETEVQWFCERKTGKKRIICSIHIYVWIWHTHTHALTAHCSTYIYTHGYTVHTLHTRMHVWKGKRRQFSWFLLLLLLYGVCIFTTKKKTLDFWCIVQQNSCRFLPLHSDAIWPSHLRTYHDKPIRPLVEFVIKYAVLWVAHSGFFLSVALRSRFVLAKCMY